MLQLEQRGLKCFVLSAFLARISTSRRFNWGDINDPELLEEVHADEGGRVLGGGASAGVAD